MPEKFYLTTPIYYVNARPHIGHAYTTIVADVLARRSRAQGNDTWFLTGTDEHGQKIERSAQAAGIPPQQFADQVSQSFRDLWQRMGITNDQYIRTTGEAHKRGVQKLFSTLYANGKIKLDTYTGAYCVSDETFVDQPVGTPCPDCGRALEAVTEENFFFLLSDYQLPLLNLIESNTLKITPESSRNEVLSFLRGDISGVLKEYFDNYVQERAQKKSDGNTDISEAVEWGIAQGKLQRSHAGLPYLPGALRDLSVSRSSFTWGIPVPKEILTKEQTTQNHVIYVWLDALANYMTAVGYGDDSEEAQAKFARYWPADLHLVGKEITRFHCIYWPAFLMAAGLPLPKAITAHGWLLFDDSKMSKSKGNIVRTETILDAFGTLCPPPPATEPGGPSFPGTIGKGGVSSEARPLSSDLPPTPNLLSSPTLSPLSSRSEGGAPGGRSLPVGVQAEGPASSLQANETSPPQNASLKGTPSGVPQEPQKIEGSGASAPEPTKHDRDLFAADVLRYYLLREIPFGQDGSFTFEALITRYNADLANGYGNLVSRTLAMIAKYFGGLIPPNITATETPQGIATLPIFSGYFDGLDFSRGLEGVWSVAIAYVDQAITGFKPWTVAARGTDTDRLKLGNFLYGAAESIRIITALLHPILPYATAKVWQQLGLGDIQLASDNGELRTLTWGGLKPGTKLGPLSPIFPRADKGLAQTMSDMEQNNAKPPVSSFVDEKFNTSPITPEDPTHPAAPPRAFGEATTVAGSNAHTTERPGTPSHSEAPASGIFSSQGPADSSPQITIDDFAKIELRVAQILVCERIPKADKLLRLEVDLGYEKRQILSGIAEWYTPEDLIGRRIVVITNLAPRKMRGLESHGMLLAASTEGGKPHLATFTGADDLPLGSRLK